MKISVKTVTRLLILILIGATFLSFYGKANAQTQAADDRRFPEIMQRMNVLQNVIIPREETYLRDNPNASNFQIVQQTLAEERAELERLREEAAQINLRTQRRLNQALEKVETREATPANCDLWNFSAEGCLKSIVSWLGAFLVWVFSRITWFANELFNQAINISVRSFSEYANMPAVATSWGVIRDLVNMGFIFVLLYIAIGTMLGLSGLDWKKLVPKLIIVALLVNFSMFFTRVVIDISNVTANQFNTSAAQGVTSTRVVEIDGRSTTITGAPDVTTALFKNIKVFSKNWLFAKSIGQDANSTAEAPGGGAALEWKQIITGTFGGMIMALVASFVLLTGALLFIVRTIRLLFLIILSPFAFFFIILPKTEGYWKKWLSTLMDDATFAPAFLIMIYLVTQITQAIGPKDDGSVIFFMLIIGLLLGAIIVAKALGAAGAAGAMKLAGATNAAILGTGVGLARVGGRFAGRGIGRGITAMDAVRFGKEDTEGKRKGSELLRAGGWTKSKIGSTLKQIDKVSPGFAGARRQASEAIKSPLRTTAELTASATKDYGISGFLGRTKDEEREMAKRAKEDKEAARDKELRRDEDELSSKTLTKERAAELLGKRKSKEISKLSKTALKNSSVIYHLNPEDLKAMNREGVDREVMKEIYNRITTDPEMGGENHQSFAYVSANPFGRRGGIATPPRTVTNPAPTPAQNPPQSAPPGNASSTSTKAPLITSEMRQQLFKLGFREKDVNAMSYEQMARVIKGNEDIKNKIFGK